MKNQNVIIIGVIVVILVTVFYLYNNLQNYQEGSPYQLCDLDYDLDCDDGDVKLFESFLGTCLKEGDPSIKVQSDVDSDNCITEKDKVLLFGGVAQQTGHCTEEAPCVSEEYVPCDNDGDKDCDLVDYLLVTNAIGTCINKGNYNSIADADRDDCVTIEDRNELFPKIPVDGFSQEMVDHLYAFDACDLNEDGVCDDADFFIFEQIFDTCIVEGDPLYKTYSDVDGNGCITWKDRNLLFPEKIDKQKLYSLEVCDINSDKFCDEEDITLFNSLIGYCLKKGDPLYKVKADGNFDGCITQDDRWFLFERTV